MTYTYKKSFGKYDSSTNFEGDVLTIEYVHSSVSEDIKVVQMWSCLLYTSPSPRDS